MDDLASRILYEDNHLIVINKMASEITQGDKTGDEPLPEKIKTYLKNKYNKLGNVFCGVIHRLDRPTSGALMFAKTSKALERMNKQFKEKETNKVYWALVKNLPPLQKDELRHFLRKNEKQNKSYVVEKNTTGAKEAILSYNCLASSDSYHLLELNLKTGRHHQIRCQLAHIGSCIKGDLKYGAPRSNSDGSISLHARKLSFTHPTTQEEIVVVAPTPTSDIWHHFNL